MSYLKSYQVIVVIDILMTIQFGCASNDSDGVVPGNMDAAETGDAELSDAGSGGCTADDAACDAAGNVALDQFTVDYEISSAINTVGIVTWATKISPVTDAIIEFGLDTNYGMQAPVDLDEPNYRTLLLGMKGSRDYHFRIVVKSGNTEYKSDDYMLTTGPVTNLVQVLEMNVDNEIARDRGFIVTSSMECGDGSCALIVDADGDVVWWYSASATLSASISRARMSYDGKYMWMVTAGQSSSSGFECVSMDGLDVRNFANPATHDITAVTGDVMAFLDGGFTSCATITEITPDGTTKPVYDTRQIWQDGPCHANAIRYSETEGLYTLSDLSVGDIIMVDRASGTLERRLSEFSFNWGYHQHGHHLLNDSIVLFNNENRIVQEISLDEANMQSSEIWRYSSAYNTEVLGDAQRLPNGNTMATYSTAGRIHEVAPDSSRVMEIRFSSTIGYSLWRESLYGPPPDVIL